MTTRKEVVSILVIQQENSHPVKMDNDPEATDDQYKEKVKEENRRKPKD